MGKVEKSIRPKLREFEESYTRNFEPVKLLERNKEGYSFSIKGEDSLDSKDLPKIIKQLKEGLTFGKDDNVTITPKKNGFTVKVKFAKGGEVMEKPTEEQQMEMMLEGGGLKDEGGTTDPVSGNEVPDGATQKGVRDDVPAMLSEGEYVMNEASTRYHGVDKFNQMQEEAKQGYVQMERDGLLGEPVDDTEEALPFGMADLNVSDEEGRELMMAEGGDVSTQRKLLQDDIDSDVFNVRRREQPTFGESMGGSGLQFKQYKNADGMNVMIPFINGVPMFSIPEGYELVDPNDPDATPVPQPVDPKEEVLEPVETPEYGGELDAIGMPVGAVGSEDSLADAAISMSQLTLGKRKPTFLESLFMKTPQYKAYNKNRLDKYGIKTGDDKLDQISLSVADLQDRLKNQPEGSAKHNELTKSLTESAYNQMALSRTLAKDVPQSGGGTTSTPTVSSPNAYSYEGDSGMGGAISAGGGGSDTFNVSPDMSISNTGEGSVSANVPDYDFDFGMGGPDGPGQGDAPSGATAGDYGYFNKGGLAGVKPKKKTKTYKKGGLATR